MKPKFKKMTCWALGQPDGTLVEVVPEEGIWTFRNKAKAKRARIKKGEHPIRIDIVPHKGGVVGNIERKCFW